MTTFSTRNQAKRKYFYIAGILVILLVIVTLAFNSFRNSTKCDPKCEPKSDSMNSQSSESMSEVNEIKDYVIISTNFGQIKGLKNKYNNITINTFLGIPYAKPPIDNLRFEKTVPLQNWEGVRDTLQQPASCLQTDSPLVLSAFRFLNSSSSEDCLYLNIWSPQQEDQFLPVIVYIHGGAFAYGGVATEELDGMVLAAQQEVVVVTIQYRLGIFGFMAFESQEPKGNMGLFDQREALKWIHSNINKFGGDQDLITVIGHGAGAVSAGLHMITPDSKSYFQRTILQGSSLMWDKELYTQSIKYSEKFADQINCLKVPKIKECIKVVNVDKLLEVQTEILEDTPVAFAPIIPNEFVSTFPSESKEMFDFQIDFMLGIYSEDDSLFLATLRNSEEEQKEGNKETDSVMKSEGMDETEKNEDKEENEKNEENSDKEEINTTTIAPPLERKTSKPILTLSTILNNVTQTINNFTLNLNFTTVENITGSLNATEIENNDNNEEDMKESTSEGSDDPVPEGEEDGDDEEDGRRRRRRKRLVEEHNVKIVCPLLQFADAIVETNRSVYIYQLNEFSSYHDEIVFAFGYPLKHQSLYDKEESKFSKYVMNNWAQFARNGDLSESDDKWLSYNKDKPSYLKLSISNIILDKFNSQLCNQNQLDSQ